MIQAATWDVVFTANVSIVVETGVTAWKAG
jgi:hypothetical protein